MSTRKSQPKTFVGLLRGINVGGRNRIKMDVLRQVFVDAGAENVRSYIQSGNIVFECDPSSVSTLSDDVSRNLERDHALRIPVVIVDIALMARAARENPFAKEAADDAKLVHFVFSLDSLSEEKTSALDFDRSPPDAIAVAGDVIFLSTPNGVARTKFTSAYFDKTLSTVTTARNSKTVQAILALASEESSS